MEFTKKDSMVCGGVMVGKDPFGHITEFDGLVCTLIQCVCCVCGAQVGYKDGEGNYGTSHTYCGPCGSDIHMNLNKQLEEMGGI